MVVLLPESWTWEGCGEAISRPAFSAWCEARFGLTATGPIQAEVDGIVANADGLVTARTWPWDSNNTTEHIEVVAVQETKLRFSRKVDPTANPDWMRQARGYCRVWGTRSVWMVVGNIGASPPEAGSRVFMLEFTDSEIEENWKMLVNVRDFLEAAKVKLTGAETETAATNDAAVDVPPQD